MAVGSREGIARQYRRVVKAMEEVVREAGLEYVYEQEQYGGRYTMCLYVHANDQPGCLIGRVLLKLGQVDLDYLKQNNSAGIEQLYSTGLHKDVLEALSWAQIAQDKGETWGVALQKMKDRAKSEGIDKR